MYSWGIVTIDERKYLIHYYIGPQSVNKPIGIFPVFSSVVLKRRTTEERSTTIGRRRDKETENDTRRYSESFDVRISTGDLERRWTEDFSERTTRRTSSNGTGRWRVEVWRVEWVLKRRSETEGIVDFR